MSYPIKANYNYGPGTDGDLPLTAANTIVNKYVHVESFSGKYVTVDLSTVGSEGYGDFTTPERHVLIHVAAYKGTQSVCSARGHWKIAYVKSATLGANGKTIIQLSKSLTDLAAGFTVAANPGDDGIYIQLVTIPSFKDVTLNSGKSITCPQFDSATGTGGIVAFRCSGTLTFNGGHINLAGKGIKLADRDSFWSAGKLVADEPLDKNIGKEKTGWENYRASFHLPLNYPDGALFCVANKMVCHKDSRIGNTSSKGVARKRDGDYDGYSSTSPRLAGGSSIVLVAKEIDEDTKDYLPDMIAKYSSIADSGKGLCRCYIATESNIPTDEALYSFDRISTPSRLRERCNIRLITEAQDGTFNSGNSGRMTWALNSYAPVIGVAKNRKTFTVSGLYEGKFKFEVGRLVMVHVNYNGYASYIEHSGRFWLARITAITDVDGLKKITIDKPAFVIGSGEEQWTDVSGWATTTSMHYATQLVLIPEFEDFILSNGKEYVNTTKYTAVNSNGIKTGYGGICAIAVKGECHLDKLANSNGGMINVEDKGGAPAYGAAGLNYIGNAQMSDRLPIGAGHGSIFILADNLVVDETSRIGATYDGSRTRGLNFDTSGTYADGDSSTTSQDIVARSSITKYYGGYGGCDAGGKTTTGHNGGYGSNSTDGAAQGAHVFIVANKITGLDMSVISTGGAGNSKFSGTAVSQAKYSALPGGAGYGGGGSLAPNGKYHGGNGGFIGGGAGAGTAENWAGGGGSGAFCFIYCNESENQSANSGINMNN